MKIIQINVVYGDQSTGKLTQQLHEALLRQGHTSLVIYGRGRTWRGQGLIRLCPNWYGKCNALISRIRGIPYGGCLLSTARLKRILRREKPDIVHLQCINGNFVNIYGLIRWLKRQRIKTVLSLHAEFMYTANCGYAYECDRWKTGCSQCPDVRRANKSCFFDRTGRSWEKMRAAFAGFEKDCVICPVSPWTEERARQSDILKDFPFLTVLNGVDTSVFHGGDSRDTTATVLHVTAQFSTEREHIKGGWYLLELARRMPQVRFVVAGRAQPLPQCPENLELLGVVSDQKALAELYRRATLTLMVSRRETFSMPCAESLCCGTPVVGFRAGAPEQIAMPDYSAFVTHGDLDALESRVRQWLARTDLDRERIAREARAVYSSETMTEKFMELYRSILWN